MKEDIETKKENKENRISLTTAFLKVRLRSLKPGETDPGCKGTKENPEIVPRKWVEPCIGKVLAPIPNRLSCPICGKKSENLLWIDYISPGWTWEQLAGNAGALSICKDCHCQVEYICVMMN